jgi:hypothetical protein
MTLMVEQIICGKLVLLYFPVLAATSVFNVDCSETMKTAALFFRRRVIKQH